MSASSTLSNACSPGHSQVIQNSCDNLYLRVSLLSPLQLTQNSGGNPLLVSVSVALHCSLAIMEPHHVDLIEDEEEDEQINIVIDLSWNRREQEKKVCEDRRVPDMKCQLEIDLNNPAEQEYPVSPIPGGDFNVPSDTTTHEYENDMEATFDKYIDWGRGTLDFMPDGRLTFYESNSPARNNSPVDDQFDYRDFDLNSVLQDVQSREDDVRTAPPAAINNDNNTDYHPEDEYIPLWLF